MVAQDTDEHRFCDLERLAGVASVQKAGYEPCEHSADNEVLSHLHKTTSWISLCRHRPDLVWGMRTRTRRVPKPFFKSDFTDDILLVDCYENQFSGTGGRHREAYFALIAVVTQSLEKQHVPRSTCIHHLAVSLYKALVLDLPICSCSLSKPRCMLSFELDCRGTSRSHCKSLGMRREYSCREKYSFIYTDG